MHQGIGVATAMQMGNAVRRKAAWMGHRMQVRLAVAGAITAPARAASRVPQTASPQEGASHDRCDRMVLSAPMSMASYLSAA